MPQLRGNEPILGLNTQQISICQQVDDMSVVQPACACALAHYNPCVNVASV
jgi:hypothetical protein